MCIEIDKWYYGYSHRRFLNLIKNYPSVPFFIDGSSIAVEGEFYRWENNTLQSKYIDGVWRHIPLAEIFDKNTLVNFIVFKTTLIIDIDKIADKITIQISKK